jgi:hypothetical protein
MHVVYLRRDKGSIPLELHWRLFEPYQPYSFDLAEVRARAQPLPGMPDTVSIMSPEHQLAHLCVHLERHAIVFGSLLSRDDWFDLLLLPQGQGRLVWMYDIAKYLQQHGPGMNWSNFVDTARRWTIERQLYAVFELCRRTFGTAPPLDVMQALNRGGPRAAERIAHRLLLASYRANGADQPTPQTRGGRWLNGAAAHALRIAHTWTTVFPPIAYLRARSPTQRSVVKLWVEHARGVIPGLHAEIRDRLRSTTTAQRQRAGR